MSCETCLMNGCDGWYPDHYSKGCRKCRCMVSYKTLTKHILKPYDTRKKKKSRFFETHKIARKAFIEFRLGYFIFAGGFIAAAAGLLVSLIPTWLFYALLFVSALFGYLVNKGSENELRREFSQQIEELRNSIDELERKLFNLGNQRR